MIMTSDSSQSHDQTMVIIGLMDQWSLSAHLAALVVDAGPGCEQDVGYDQVPLPAGGEQRRPHPAVHTVHISPVEQQNLECHHRVRHY